MSVDHRSALIFFLLVSLTGLHGCSSSPEVTSEADLEASVATPGADEIYDDAARWLAPDTEWAMVAAWEPFWEVFGNQLLPTALPDADPGTPGTLEGFQSDFATLLTEHFSIDPTSADALAIGIGPDESLSAVLFGDIELPDHLSPISIGEHEAYRLNEVHEFVVNTPSNLLLHVTDEPRPGLVLAEQSHLEEALQGDSPSPPQGMGKLLHRLDDPSIAIAFSRGSLVDNMVTHRGFPLPEYGVLGMGRTQASLIARDDDATLDDLESMIDHFRDEGQRSIEDHSDTHYPDITDALIVLHLYHLSHSVLAQLQPTRDDGHLRYNIGYEGTPYGAIHLLGLGAALAIPAFQTYRRRAQASEAEFILQQLADRMIVHYDHYGQFPGGPHVEIMSHSRVPQSGQAQVPDPTLIRGDIDDTAESFFQTLGFPLDGPLYFRYTYSTLEGDEGAMMLVAHHNFEPDIHRQHTTRLIIDLDDQDRPVARPMWTQNEFE